MIHLLSTPTMETSPQGFALVFEGISQSPGFDIRLLKAALVSDLELSVEQAQKILSGTQMEIRRGNNLDELEYFKFVLENAGARVALKDVQEAPSIAEESLEESFASPPNDIESPLVAEPPEADDAFELGQAEEDLLVDQETDAHDQVEALDPLEQITDIFRDLETSCVTSRGPEVLREIPKVAKLCEGALPSVPAATRGPLLTQKPREKLLKRKFWYRVVTWPEVVFAVGFSVILSLITGLLFI